MSIELAGFVLTDDEWAELELPVRAQLLAIVRLGEPVERPSSRRLPEVQPRPCDASSS